MIPNTFSQAAVNIIKAFEGLHKVGSDDRIYAYQDPVGIWTIGYGSTKIEGRPVNSKDVITREEAEKLLIHDIEIHVRPIHQHVKVPLTQPQYDALASFIFNVGGTNFARSTLLKKLNQGDYDGAADQFRRWNKAGGKVLRGLTRRRAAEAALFTMEAPIGQDGITHAQPHEIEEDIKPIEKSRTLWGVGISAFGVIANEIAKTIEPFAGIHEYLQWGFIILSIVGAGIAAYARVNDRNTGKN